MASVQILLATRNGERFLEQQLDSLFSQSLQDFEVLAADDGSTDRTLAILDATASRAPDRLRVLFRTRVGSPQRNFMRLLDAASAPYVCFSDQDDVWLPDKVAALVETCRYAERTHPSMPVLVHSDLAVVDESLRLTSPSLFEHQKMRPEHATFRYLLLQSNVSGCALLMNGRLLARIKGSDPDRMVMHDWWASLVAAALGRIEYLPRPTIWYRQHSANAQGARQWTARRALSRAMALARGESSRSLLTECANQASAFLERFRADLTADQVELAAAVASLPRRSRLARSCLLLRHGLLCGGFLRNSARLLAKS